MATSKNQSAGPKNKGLRVVAKRGSFYRAGLQFGSEPRTIALADLTPEQVEAITGEPMLVAVEVDIEV
jgi:hypothetical protein